MLTDHQERVGFVPGICNDLMKLGHFLFSKERKKKHIQLVHAKETEQIGKKLIKQQDSVQTGLSSV